MAPSDTPEQSDGSYHRMFPHPSHPLPPPISLRARVSVEDGASLRGDFELTHQVGSIRWPTKNDTPRFRDQLWEHTCFELFIAEETTSAYAEYNFSPSGHWAAYRFDSYRTGRSELVSEKPEFNCSVPTDNPFKLHWMIKLPRYSGGTERFQLNLAAVIEDLAGDRYYYALAHPDSTPDFHHRTSFSVTVGK